MTTTAIDEVDEAFIKDDYEISGWERHTKVHDGTGIVVNDIEMGETEIDYRIRSELFIVMDDGHVHTVTTDEDGMNLDIMEDVLRYVREGDEADVQYEDLDTVRRAFEQIVSDGGDK